MRNLQDTKINEDKFPALLQLFGGYFHEEWMHDHKTEDDAIQQFLKDSTKETILEAKKELLTILRLFRSEGEIEDFLSNYTGFTYYYPYAWLSARDWLEYVLSKL